VIDPEFMIDILRGLRHEGDDGLLTILMGGSK
jgi:hypothetical protein